MDLMLILWDLFFVVAFGFALKTSFGVASLYSMFIMFPIGIVLVFSAKRFNVS
jgi:hypothetical protein